jgi:hypothetical protein
LPTAIPTNDAEAAALARTTAAGLVVTAEPVTAKEGRVRGTDVEAARAQISIKAVDPEGRVVGNAQSTGRGFAPMADEALGEAMGQAARQAAERVAGELALKYGNVGEALGPGIVLVHVVGLRSYRELEDTTRFMSQLPGVERALPRRMGGGDLWMSLRAPAGGRALAQTIAAQGMQVDAASDREVRVRAQRGEP